MSSIDLESLNNFWLFVVIMGTLKFLFETARVYKSYQENRYFSLDKVKEAFETDKIDNKLREQLIETYEREIFHKIYRLSVSKEARSKIIDISKNSNEIECATFRKANKYIDYQTNSITLRYRKIYTIEKLYNKFSAYMYYGIFVFFTIGFLVSLFNYENLSIFYSQIGNAYLLLCLGIYSFLGSFLCMKKEVALEAAIKLKDYATSYPNDIRIIYKNTWVDKITEKFLDI
ncbi:hypothetical protein [uncultured Psychrobacter sp.]|uniref:hypothetical protein n=1 Tax=uncultured Psychrobacter sp. TaxID=259303 RepID=UPI003458DC43